MAAPASTPGRFSALLLEGLDHYRKGRMLEAVRAWEEAYLLEPTNLRAREFLRSALERIHAHMGPTAGRPPLAEQTLPPREPLPDVAPPAGAPHPWLPPQPIPVSQTQVFAAPPAPAVSQTQAVAAPPAPAVSQTQVFAAPPAPAVSQTQVFSTPPAVPAVSPTMEFAAPPPAGQPDANALTALYQARPAFMDPPVATVTAQSKGPWDDGPSMAIPQPEEQAADTSGAWSIHKEALPIEAVADDETEVWTRGARELVGLNDFSGALELLDKILSRKPGDKEAQQMHELCESNLTLMFESKIGAMEARPRMAIPPDEVIWLNLDPRAGFVLAQIDGEVSFEDLYAICGLKRLDTARILCELLEQGVVSVQGQDRAVAKRAMHRS